MKKLGQWLLCCAFVMIFITGCGMFGSTGFYQALAAMCMRCHGTEEPSKTDVKKGSAEMGMQMQGPQASIHGCPFEKGRK
jgi:cytochrome c553